MTLWWLLPLAAATSALLTGGLRRYALARNLLDVPNSRSAHTRPTPRGGGVAIVVTFLAGVGVLASLKAVEPRAAAALGGAGVIVALVGFLDDHHSIAARWRLLAHFAAAAWALTWLGGLPPLDLLGVTVSLGWAGHVLAAVYLAWLLNLYNFMDGIDGIAGLEAVTVGLGGALLYAPAAPGDPEWLLPALLAMAALGFLGWNWPPARIFMGDAGSGFLGMTLGVMSIIAAWRQPELLWSWIVLLGIFVVDATMTLLRRLQRGEKLYEAHSYHAYQRVARRLGAHRPVALTVGAINLFWLLPIAMAVRPGGLTGLAGVLIAYTPLVWLGIRYDAGANLDS